MESNTYRPRVSRETRLLLTTAAVAVAALWVLARARFPDQPASPNPVQPLLTQLAGGTSFSSLAAEVARLVPRIDPLVLALPESGASSPRFQALRVADDLAVAVTAAAPDAQAQRDPASGLTLIPIRNVAGPPLAVWPPVQLEQPRYLAATDVAGGTVSVRPVFVGALEPIASALWPDDIWVAPGGTDIEPGSFLFTNNAELVGMVVQENNTSAIVPASVLMAEVQRLAIRPPQAPSTIGVEVQTLTPAVSAATGAPGGAVVAWVDPAGPAARALVAGDVIEGAGGQPVASRADLEVRIARAFDGERIPLRVRRAGRALDVDVTARAVPRVAPTPMLGLELRRAANRGSEIVRVDAGSVAERAGLEPGDVITLFAQTRAPSPAQVAAQFAAAPAGQPVLVAVSRAGAHRVLTFTR